MKRILFIVCAVLTAGMLRGQVVKDNFQVGPYDVDYLGKGDVNYRLKKGIDLYDYFGLVKDTVFIEKKKDKPIKRAFELEFSYSNPRFEVKGAFNSFGIYGLSKSKVGKYVYLNYGGTVGVSYGRYNEEMKNLKDVLFEVGLPLSVEFADLNRLRSSLYANIGFTPAFYTAVMSKELSEGEEVDSEKKNGVYIAPKLELGGYITANEHLIKVGVFGEYRISCAKEEDNIFKERIGRAFVGAKIGCVF